MREYVLIDPPVTRWSKPSAIRAWVEELERMQKRPEVDRALAEAREWLEDSERRARIGVR